MVFVIIMVCMYLILYFFKLDFVNIYFLLIFNFVFSFVR